MDRSYRTKVDGLLRKREQASTTLQAERQALRVAEDRYEYTQVAVQVVQEVAGAMQAQLHAHLSQIVGRALVAVFDDPYEFRIRFVTRRDRTEAVLEFVRNGEAYSPLGAVGGGVVDVAAFALRVGSLTLVRPALRPLLLLDEPFRFVAARHRDRLRGLVEALAYEFGIQFLIVTHIEELQIGKVVEL